MGIAAGMKEITQNIASSYNVRIAEVGRLKEEAKKKLGSFRASHKEMGIRLREDLAQDKAEIRAEVKAMRKGFQSSHREMSSVLRKDLTNHTRGVKDQVAKMRQEIRASHQEMSTELKKSLAQGMATRKSEVKDTLNNLHSSRKQMGTQLRRELADYDRGMKSEVTGTRQRSRADLKEASATWQELASTMQAKRRGAKVPPKVEAEEETPDLEAKLLAAINEHPNGITLAEVAKSLGVVPVVLGRAARSLLEKGKIRKEEKLYFPVSTE